MVLFHNVMLGLLIRGFAFGVVAGLIILVVFMLTQDRGVVVVAPNLFLYFLGGVLLGLAFIGGLAFWGLHPLGQWYREKARQAIQDSGNPLP